MSTTFGSVAIAGAWGYIGRKLLDAAIDLDLTVYAFDPGVMPPDVDLNRIVRLQDEATFYQLPADFFHLAIHPEHRQYGFARLLERAKCEPIAMLIEKPMALPERPQDCDQIMAAVESSSAMIFYNFPELFDPVTQHVWQFLATLSDVQISDVFVQRSKDREDPANSRNYKKMVSIQYQESVHCLAFVLSLLAKVHGSVSSVIAEDAIVSANSEPYVPPNPEEYPQPVDGRCEYSLQLGKTHIRGLTDFKRNAVATKRRIILGMADGQPFEIDAEYLEGRKHLLINRQRIDIDPAASSYAAIVESMLRWRHDFRPVAVREGIYSNPRLAHLAYQLSSAIWKSAHQGGSIDVPMIHRGALLEFKL